MVLSCCSSTKYSMKLKLFIHFILFLLSISNQQILDHVHCQLFQMLANSKHWSIWKHWYGKKRTRPCYSWFWPWHPKTKIQVKLQIMKWKTHSSKSLLFEKNWRLACCLFCGFATWVFVPEVLALLVKGVVEKPESYGQQITTGRGLARKNGKWPEWNLQSECIIGALMLIVLNHARVLEFFIMASSLTRCSRVLQASNMKYNNKFVNTGIFFIT
jgi:hypothetical protein